MPSAGEEKKEKRLDLSVPQVAGSALAAVVAAKLASYFGVYGTILGAGVVSVIATCGGPVFQHFFRRTAEQIREVAVASKAAVAVGPGRQTPAAPGEFTEGTVYRARVKNWKRPVLAAVLVFGVTMAGITAWELLSGSSFAGGNGTTVGNAVTGHRTSSSNSGDQAPASSISQTSPPTTDGRMPTSGAASDSPDRGTASSPTPMPDATRSTGTGSAGTGSPAGTATPPPASGASATPPAPSASSGSGSAVPDPGAPAAQ
ncbi:hypothetical protein ABZV31_30710 [Streptomyces sp. NPDC005202]|uniref:hypothetical protein n=1 Tax=Streptomyces sp. NPDC005202 TaxID=3157021 RepID=UPI0033BCF0C3